MGGSSSENTRESEQQTPKKGEKWCVGIDSDDDMEGQQKRNNVLRDYAKKPGFQFIGDMVGINDPDSTKTIEFKGEDFLQANTTLLSQLKHLLSKFDTLTEEVVMLTRQAGALMEKVVMLTRQLESLTERSKT